MSTTHRIDDDDDDEGRPPPSASIATDDASATNVDDADTSAWTSSESEEEDQEGLLRRREEEDLTTIDDDRPPPLADTSAWTSSETDHEDDDEPPRLEEPEPMLDDRPLAAAIEDEEGPILDAAASDLSSSDAEDEHKDDVDDDMVMEAEPRTARPDGEQAVVTDDDENDDDDSDDNDVSANEVTSDVEPVDNAALLSRIATGSRLEVYWPADERYHPCVVVDRDSAGVIHTLRYEDGAVERIDLTWEVIRPQDEGGDSVTVDAGGGEDYWYFGAGLDPEPGGRRPIPAVPLSPIVASESGREPEPEGRHPTPAAPISSIVASEPESEPEPEPDWSHFIPVAPLPPMALSPPPPRSGLSPIPEGDEGRRGDLFSSSSSETEDEAYREFLRVVGGGGPGPAEAPATAADDVAASESPPGVEEGGNREYWYVGDIAASEDAGSLAAEESKDDLTEDSDSSESIDNGAPEESDSPDSVDNGTPGDSDSPESIDNGALLSAVAAGSRLEVYWPADKSYHPCVVVDRDVAGAIHTLRYEDGVVERIDLTWENFRLGDETDRARLPATAIVGFDSDPGTGALSPVEEEQQGAAASEQPGNVDDEGDATHALRAGKETGPAVGGGGLPSDDGGASQPCEPPAAQEPPRAGAEPPDGDGGEGESSPVYPAVPASPRVDLRTPYAMAPASSDVSETIDNEALLASVAVGSRLEVYWRSDGKYHACVVTDRDSEGAIHTLRYDDRTAETIDLTWEIFRPGPDAASPPREPPAVPTPSTANDDETGLPTVPSPEPLTASPPPRVDLRTPYAMAPSSSDSAETIDNTALLARIAAGARLEVYWPADGKYHACVVANRDSEGGIHALCYDDGMVETIDLTWEIFRLSSDNGDGGALRVADATSTTLTGDIEEGGAGTDEGDNAPVVSDEGNANSDSDSQIDLKDASETKPGAEARGGLEVGNDHVTVDTGASVGPEDVMTTALAGDIEEGVAATSAGPSEGPNAPVASAEDNGNSISDSQVEMEDSSETILGADASEGLEAGDDHIAAEKNTHVGPDDVREQLMPGDNEGELGRPEPPLGDYTPIPQTIQIEEGLRDSASDGNSTEPFWQQKRAKVLLDVLAISVVIIVIILVATLLNQRNNKTAEVVVAPSFEPSSSVNPTSSPITDTW